jgi:hypothetical protein
MRQALHIFKKDARHLLYEITVTLALVALVIGSELHLVKGYLNAGTVLLPLAWWILVVRVIYDEPIPGDRQFWVTRPYSWKSLLAAKALFVLAFINLPMLVADLVILPAYGFYLSEHVTGLLWTQVLLTIAFVVPIAAVASVTTGLAQSVLVFILVGFAVLISAVPLPDPGWSATNWIRTSLVVAILALAALIVLFWQYQRRGVIAARILIALVVLFIAIGSLKFPWHAAFELQSRMFKPLIDGSSVKIVLSDALPHTSHYYGPEYAPKSIAVLIPIQIVGNPSETEAKADAMFAEIRAASGERVNFQANFLTHDPSGDWEVFLIDRSDFQKVKNKTVTVRSTLYVTIFGNRKSTMVPSSNKFVNVPGVGLCSATPEYVQCRSAFREPDHTVSVRSHELSKSLFNAQFTYSPFPADGILNPINTFMQPTEFQEPSEVVFMTEEPLAHLHRDVEFRDLKLDDFVIGQPAQSRDQGSAIHQQTR